LLLWRRTRVLAYLAALAFHLTNWYLFNIGIFPWIMICATLLFFPPSWPRYLQLTHLMADRLRAQGYQDVEVYVRALTSLNGRRQRDLIDPNVNLAAKERSVWPADWLVPLDEPLRR
jgi:hypothetical protein